MDKSEGKEGESSKEQFDLSDFPEQVKDVDENFPESSRINEELGLKNEEEIDKENSGDVPVNPHSVHQQEVVTEVTDSVEQNPDVESGNLITGQIGSSSHGTMSFESNVLGQGTDGTRLSLDSASSSLGAMPLNKNDSAEQPELGLHLRPPHNLPRYVDSSFFIPRGVHEHNMRIRSHPDMFCEYRRAPPVQMVPPMVEMRPTMVEMRLPRVEIPPPMVQMVPPMVEIRPPMVEMRPPRVEIPPPMVQMVPPMVEMRPPMVQMRPPVGQMGGHRGVIPDSMRASTNINMAVRSGGEQGGRIGEASDGGELESQDTSQQNDEQGSASRDAKRPRR